MIAEIELPECLRMSSPNLKIADVLRRDRRYAYPAYLFIFEALEYTQDQISRRESPHQARHVTGPELLRGVTELAQRDFGLLASAVFRVWGIQVTDDVGEIVFNLIEGGLLSKNDRDDRADFHDVFDLEEALREGYEIRCDDQSTSRKREPR